MSGDRPDGGRGAEEERRGWLRLIAGAVILVLLVILSLVDVLGRLFINPNFHVDPVMFGSLLGALVLISGVEAASRLPWSGPK